MSTPNANTARAAPTWLPYVAVAALLSILVILLTSVAVWQESRRHQERAVVVTQTMARLLGENIEDIFARADAFIQSTALYYADQRAQGSLEPARFNTYLDQQLALFPGVADLRITDAKGMVRFGTRIMTTVSLADRTHFIRSRESVGQELIFDGPTVTRLTKKWVIVLARRLDNPDGSFAGDIHANIDIDYFSKIFSEISLGDSGTLVLRDLNMALIQRVPTVDGPDNAVGNKEVSQQLLNLVARQPQGGTYVATSPMDHVERTYTYYKVPGYPFYMIAGRASSDFLAAWRTNAYLLLGLCGLMLLATFGGTWQIYRLSQRRADHALFDVLTLQTAILEHAADAIVATDAQGIITVFNKAAERMTGYLADEVIGKRSAIDFYAPAEVLKRTKALSTLRGKPVKPGFTALVEPYVRGGVLSDEVTYVRRDATRFPAMQSVTALRNPSGDITGYMAIVTDISEQQAKKKRLDDTMVRLKLATEAADIGVWSWDFIDNKLTWDDRLCSFYELTAAEREKGLYYDLWESRIHPSDRERSEKLLALARSNNTPYHDSFRILMPDGRIRYIQSSATNEHDDSGIALRMVGVNRDVTLERELEAQLRAAKDAAESANQAKSLFLANISHEIRTPMNAVIGLTQLTLETELTTRQRHYLKTVQNSANALLHLINDILDLSKIEAGQMEMRAEPFAMNTLLGEVIDLFADAFKEKGLSLHTLVAPDIPPFLRGDALRLRQVLVNLLSNALKFTERGEIDIQVTRIAASASTVTLHIQVRDTGIGMTAEQADRLFSPFTQADESITRRYGGTGLGLSISRQLVKLMGGEIRVDSQVGHGTTFSLTAEFEMIAPRDYPTELPPDVLAQVYGPGTLSGESRARQTRHGTMETDKLQAPTAWVDRTRLYPLLAELERMLATKMLAARAISTEIEMLLKGTDLEAHFKPIMDATFKLKFDQARNALPAFVAVLPS